MPNRTVCLAVDLGAGSGRVVAGIHLGDELRLQEIHRFANEPVTKDSGLHWDFSGLMEHVVDGIAKAVEEFGEDVASLGVDTWGVDYGLLDHAGTLISDPFHYRDSRTDGIQALVDEVIAPVDLYARTGIQPMFFNTLLQLVAEKHSSDRLDRATSLLFMPDLVHYHLTGQRIVERTIASTSQLLNAETREWDLDVIARFNLPTEIFGELCDAGTQVGLLKSDTAARVGRAIPVIAPGCHDTASAVAGVPTDDEDPVFLSSGTWSLLGRELAQPRLESEVFDAGFSNEAGVGGTVRLLQNIPGMWLLQESKREWAQLGIDQPYAQLLESARGAEPFAAFVNPDHPSLRAPDRMASAIAAMVGNPELARQPGPLSRCILESIALSYRRPLDELEHLSEEPISTISIVGGGSQNDLLNQFAADATGRHVVAGPVEATSAGSVIVQLVALGRIPSLAAGRALIKRSFETKTFRPEDSAAWIDKELPV